MSHFQHRYGVPKSPVFRFCKRKWNHTSKFNIASLYIFPYDKIYGGGGCLFLTSIIFTY